MTEEKWRKQEARIRRQPKWPIWIHIGWFFVCGVAWMKYPAIGEGWHGLVFMGVFLEGI